MFIFVRRGDLFTEWNQVAATKECQGSAEQSYCEIEPLVPSRQQVSGTVNAYARCGSTVVQRTNC